MYDVLPLFIHLYRDSHSLFHTVGVELLPRRQGALWKAHPAGRTASGRFRVYLPGGYTVKMDDTWLDAAFAQKVTVSAVNEFTYLKEQSLFIGR